MKLFERPIYLERLWRWRDKDVIKVISGMRRCGKSTLLQLFQSRLLASGVKKSQVVAINLEDLKFSDLSSWRELWDYIKPKLKAGKKTYVFLDEIQRVQEFEKLVDGLYANKDVDVYITGSNAYLLSGELATYLSGRYVEIRMQPLSFREYCAALSVDSDFMRHYAEYVRWGSLPYVLTLADTARQVGDYLDGIYNTVLVKDVLSRKRLSDTSLVNRIARFLFDNVGNLVSVRNVSNNLNAGGASTNANTVDGYIDALCDAFLFYKAERFDVRGKALLRSGFKYYAADLGLRNRLIGYRVGDYGHVLENVVYLELLRRSQNVYVGQHDSSEIDFVTRDNGELQYYQVAETVRDHETREREYAPLRALRDSYPKTLITLDEEPPADLDGIRQINAIDFLLGRGYL